MNTELIKEIARMNEKIKARQNSSCYMCFKKTECMYDGRFRETCTFQTWCEECVKRQNEKEEVKQWKPDESCDCDECSDARYWKKDPEPSYCEFYPYWSFLKIKTKA
jgi:hypothetical protein